MHTLNILEKITDILLSVVSVVGITYGIKTAQNYRSKLKEKYNDSLFSFYARLNVYLLDFQNKLGNSSEKNILLYKYLDSSLRNMENFIKPKDEEVKSFVGFILEFIDFLKNAENQISLSESFHSYFEKFKKILFDLTKLTGTTPYTEYNNNNPVTKEYNSINSLVNKLLNIIEEEQNNILKLKKI